MKKIQTKELEKDIERRKDISEVWLYGGNEIGEIVRPQRRKNVYLLTDCTKHE